MEEFVTGAFNIDPTWLMNKYAWILRSLPWLILNSPPRVRDDKLKIYSRLTCFGVLIRITRHTVIDFVDSQFENYGLL